MQQAAIRIVQRSFGATGLDLGSPAKDVNPWEALVVARFVEAEVGLDQSIDLPRLEPHGAIRGCAAPFVARRLHLVADGRPVIRPGLHPRSLEDHRQIERLDLGPWHHRLVSRPVQGPIALRVAARS